MFARGVGQMPPVPTEEKNSDAAVARAPLLYRIADAVLATGLSRSKVYELVDDGELTTVHFGRAVRITAESLHALIERRTDSPREPLAPSETRKLLSGALARQGRKPAASNRDKRGAKAPATASL
jgi:excisionase family DNA binding protein